MAAVAPYWQEEWATDCSSPSDEEVQRQIGGSVKCKHKRHDHTVPAATTATFSFDDFVRSAVPKQRARQAAEDSEVRSSKLPVKLPTRAPVTIIARPPGGPSAHTATGKVPEQPAQAVPAQVENVVESAEHQVQRQQRARASDPLPSTAAVVLLGRAISSPPRVSVAHVGSTTTYASPAFKQPPHPAAVPLPRFMEECSQLAAAAALVTLGFDTSPPVAC